MKQLTQLATDPCCSFAAREFITAAERRDPVDIVCDLEVMLRAAQGDLDTITSQHRRRLDAYGESMQRSR